MILICITINKKVQSAKARQSLAVARIPKVFLQWTRWPSQEVERDKLFWDRTVEEVVSYSECIPLISVIFAYGDSLRAKFYLEKVVRFQGNAGL